MSKVSDQVDEHAVLPLTGSDADLKRLIGKRLPGWNSPALNAGEADFVLIVDHLTGAVTRWPRLPLDTLTHEYGKLLTPRPGTPPSSSGRA